jgi:ankyrin repeat protein
MWAVLDDHFDTTRILTEHGATPNWRSNSGATALHSAALKENPNLAKFLVEHGANPNITDYDGQLPKDWAKSDEVLKYLDAKG